MGFYQAPVEAISIGFQPVTQTIPGGDAFSVDVVISGLTTNAATVLGGRTGTVETKVVTPTNTVKRTIDVSTQVTGWTVVRGTNGFHSGCPQSGTITSTIDVTVDRGEIPVTTSWQYNVTADNGTLTGTVTAGSVEKTYTKDVCTM